MRRTYKAVIPTGAQGVRTCRLCDNSDGRHHPRNEPLANQDLDVVAWGQVYELYTLVVWPRLHQIITENHDRRNAVIQAERKAVRANTPVEAPQERR